MFESLFGAGMPLAVRFFLAFLIVMTVIGIPLVLLTFRIRARIRRLIITISEALALMLILLFTIGGGLSATIFSLIRSNFLLSNDQQVERTLYAVIAFIFGGISGFIVSAIGLAILFMLIEIAENTRKTVAFFDKVNARVQH